MWFRVEMPPSRAAYWTRCSEPKCGRRFWHIGRNNPSRYFICGVDPDETEHRRPDGERANVPPDDGAPVEALAAQRAFLPELPPAPIRPDERGPCDEPAAFLGEGG